jgi:hypothetical protein
MSIAAENDLVALFSSRSVSSGTPVAVATATSVLSTGGGVGGGGTS